jgi:hypothetical protein
MLNFMNMYETKKNDKKLFMTCLSNMFMQRSFDAQRNFRLKPGPPKNLILMYF